MISRRIPVLGELMGQRIATRRPAYREDVVRIIVEGRPEGPAENSIILVRVSETGEKRARYLSWIGYHDLDVASSTEPGAWQLIEPATPYREKVEWHPYSH